VRKDKEAGKATFVSLLGREDAKAWAQSLVNEACDALTPFGRRAEGLKAAAQFVVSRNN
jgi:farnesyl diphosphate synthase